MGINIALLEKDQIYLNRIVAVFSNKFADKLEVYAFTDLQEAMDSLDKNKIDVFVSSDGFEINCNELPKNCGFAYFAESLDIETIRNQKTICKFQKVEFIYKEILGIYSEIATNRPEVKVDTVSTKIVSFVSASGGVGTTAVSVACARYFSNQGKKTLFLSLEPFGNINYFFKGEGSADFSDVLYTIKNKKSNPEVELENNVKQDLSGVYFFDAPKSALDIQGMTNEELIQLLIGLKAAGTYDYIVTDSINTIDKKILDIMKIVHAAVFVTDGTEISNDKFHRAYQALQILEQEAGLSILNKIAVLYNKFCSGTGQPITFAQIKNVGVASRFEHATAQQVVEQLSNMQMFGNIVV